MMVAFQRKIIYMGGVPLGSRSEELQINDKNMKIGEITVQSTENVMLHGIVVARALALKSSAPPLVIMYLQGNAGNPLHRIPKFRLLLDGLMDNLGREAVVVAAAPRSYWKSTNKSPSEAGFLSDYAAVLEWISTTYPRSPVVLYGHSIGGSVAVKLLGSLPAHASSNPNPAPEALGSRVRGLVLENAFTSIPDMVRTLYPSKWLPYYYLGPLAFDKWDALGTLRRCTRSDSAEIPQRSVLQKVIISPPSVLIINSGNDELVPPQMGQDMFDVISRIYGRAEAGSGPKRVVIPSALHDDAFAKRQWKGTLKGYIAEVVPGESRQ